MDEWFVRLSLHEPVVPVTLGATATFDAFKVPDGSWPSEYGGAAQASVLGEPLTTDSWSLAWQVPLGSVSPPRCVLSGAGRLVVTGLDRRGVWTTDGSPLNSIPVGDGVALVDTDGQRYWCDDGQGLVLHTLSDGARAARVRLAFPSAHETRQILCGPDGVRVFLSVDVAPHGRHPDVIVEAFRVEDYDKTSARGIFYGLAPLGGLRRDDDSHARMAATAAGPVIATREGVRFCDWRLHTLHEVAAPSYPLAVSTDGAGRAYVVSAGEDSARLIAFESGGVVFDVALPWSAWTASPPPIVAPSHLVLTPPGHLLIVDFDGQILVHEPRPASPPATITSNGIVLLPQEKLMAVTSDGDRFPVWAPPAPLRTAPVLVNGTLYAATADTLYALR